MSEHPAGRPKGMGRQILAALFPLGIAIVLFFALLLWFAAQEPASSEAQNIAYGVLGLSLFFLVTLIRAIVAIVGIIARRGRTPGPDENPPGLSTNTSPPPPPPSS